MGSTSMQFTDEVTERGVTERAFSLSVDDEHVPGILWTPEGAEGPRPVVLIGHGGTQHKRVPNVLGMARRFVRHLGYAAVALDAPEHGDRIADPEAAEAARRNLEQRIAGGGTGSSAAAPGGMTAEQAKAMSDRSAIAAGEWRALVDQLAGLPDVGIDRVGYWGVSMGTAIGLPFVASEPRVRSAVLGLFGLGNRPGGEAFEAAARSLSIPVLFVFQWDDELMTREAGMSLFDALGSEDKAMHVFPGGHVGTPLHERDAYEAFYLRTLGEV